jgi:hypothetical protein
MEANPRRSQMATWRFGRGNEQHWGKHPENLAYSLRITKLLDSFLSWFPDKYLLSLKKCSRQNEGLFFIPSVMMLDDEKGMFSLLIGLILQIRSLV